jgi:hypothetical protein
MDVCNVAKLTDARGAASAEGGALHAAGGPEGRGEGAGGSRLGSDSLQNRISLRIRGKAIRQLRRKRSMITMSAACTHVGVIAFHVARVLQNTEQIHILT